MHLSRKDELREDKNASLGKPAGFDGSDELLRRRPCRDDDEAVSCVKVRPFARK
jgi:hypothetical protein